MTDSQKQSEIVERIKRLSDLRGELAVASSKLNKMVRAVAEAGRHYAGYISKIPSRAPKPSEWSSSEEVSSQEQVIVDLKREADVIIGELKDLGVDDGLFKINGT